MRTIKLTQNKETIVDDWVYEAVGHLKWFLDHGKARRTLMRKGKTWVIYLHHIVIGRPINRKLDIDHINRNPLDNRLVNLRIVTRSVNVLNTGLRSTNTSGYKGISYDTTNKAWCIEYCRKYLGRCKTLTDAIELRSKLVGDS